MALVSRKMPYPEANVSADLMSKWVCSERYCLINSANKTPSSSARLSSRATVPNTVNSIFLSSNSARAIDLFVANIMITTTSMITVTPKTNWVKGPLARSSLIIAMADEGDRATKMVPVMMDTAIWLVAERSRRKGMKFIKNNVPRLPKTNVQTTSPTVTHAIDRMRV